LPLKELADAYAAKQDYKSAHQKYTELSELMEKSFRRRYERDVRHLRETMQYEIANTENKFLLQRNELNQLLLKEKEQHNERQSIMLIT